MIIFANRLKPYRAGIIVSAQHHLNTSILEGMNNRIKVIKHMVYRDSEYFFLIIKAAFPANRDKPDKWI